MRGPTQASRGPFVTDKSVILIDIGAVMATDDKPTPALLSTFLIPWPALHEGKEAQRDPLWPLKP